MAVTVDIMKEAQAADDELWAEYLHEVSPDDQQYLTYYRWLALKVMQFRMDTKVRDERA